MRLIKSVLFTGIIVFLLGGSTFAYSDLPYNLSSKLAIESFTEQGIIEGYPDGTFGPSKSINRAEAMKIITLVFPLQDHYLTEVEVNFSDTEDESWYMDYVKEGVARKIVQGYVDGTFKPANQVSFSESIKMGLVAAGLDIDQVEYSDFHYEIKAEDWYAKYFKYGFEKNLYDLNPEGDIEPLKPMNRGDFVELMYRIQSLDVDDPESEFDISYNWQTSIDKTGLSVKSPLSWEVQKIDDGLLMGYFGNGQVNFLNPGEDSASIGFFHWVNKNKLTAGAYFEDLKQKYSDDYPGAELTITETSSSEGPSIRFSVVASGVIDNYIFVSEDQILAGQAKYDTKSSLSAQFQEQIIKSYEEIEFLSLASFLSTEEKLELAREYLLVEGEGKNILELFDETELFETDTLGVGTGPVDYYYVVEINYTFKYERNSDILLDLMQEKTSAF